MQPGLAVTATRMYERTARQYWSWTEKDFDCYSVRRLLLVSTATILHLARLLSGNLVCLYPFRHDAIILM